MSNEYQNDHWPILHISWNTFHRQNCFVSVTICNYPFIRKGRICRSGRLAVYLYRPTYVLRIVYIIRLVALNLRIVLLFSVQYKSNY